MQSRILGTTMPVLEFALDPNESVISEAGELSWMTSSIQMTTHTQFGGGGGIFGVLKRAGRWRIAVHDGVPGHCRPWRDFLRHKTAGARAAQLVAIVDDRFGGVDIPVNAAGVFYPTPAGLAQQDPVERMIAVNLGGTFNMINAVVPIMKSRGCGKIVNISSLAGVIGLGNYGVYFATKFGVIGLTRALAVELAPDRINVNAIAPGNTETPMNEDIRTDPKLKEVYAYMKSRTPSRRVYSTPADMARAALFLASDDGVAMYGSTMLLDEGLAAGI